MKGIYTDQPSFPSRVGKKLMAFDVATKETGHLDAEYTKADVGLDQVANTSDADKPVSTAQQTALDLKADKSGCDFTGPISATQLSGNGSGLTNISADKFASMVPISISGAMEGSTTFDGSAPISIELTANVSPTITLSGGASGTATFTDLGNTVLNVTIADNSHGHTIANVAGLQTSLDSKALSSSLTSHTSNTSNPHATTKAHVGLGNCDNTADSAKNVLSATKLTTARTIGGVSFNGTANINLPGVNTAGTQSTTGNAATATKLFTARSISGAIFDGSADVTIPAATTFANGLMASTDKEKLDALNSSLYAKLADNNIFTGKNVFNTDGTNQVTLARSSDTVYGGISLLTGGQLNWLLLESNDGTGNLSLQSRNYKSTGEFMQTVFNVTWSTGVMNFSVSPTILGSKVWTAANDGAGSGLDAGLLAGLEWSAFLRTDVDTTKTAGKAIFNDGIVSYYGTDQDSSIYHSGTAMYLGCSTGNINIRSTTNGNSVFIQAKDSDGNQDNVVSAKSSGADTWASLYFNNTETLKTTSTGVEVTGGLNATSVEVGKGSGSAALTYNDGYGNCNVTFNHKNGTPDFSGNAGRIQVNTDSSTGAAFTFHLSSGVTAGVTGACPTVFTFSETAIAFLGYQLTHAGQSTNVAGSYAVLQNKTGSTCILDAEVSGALLNKDPSTAIGTGTWKCKQYTLADGWGLFQRKA